MPVRAGIRQGGPGKGRGPRATEEPGVDLLKRLEAKIRVPSGIPARLRAGGQTVEGRVVDLGAGGACFLASRPLPRGDRVTVRLGPYGKLSPVELPAQILEVRPGAAEGWRHGLEFADLSLTRQGQLGFYVNALLEEQEDT